MKKDKAAMVEGEAFPLHFAEESQGSEKLKEEFKKQTRQLIALMKVSAKMIRTTNLRERLKVIAKAIRSLGWGRVVISHRDENLEIIELVTAGLTPEEERLLLERRVPGHVWRERFGPKYDRYRIGAFYYLPWNDPWVRENVHKIPKGIPPDEAVRYMAGVPSKMPPERTVDWHPQDMLYAPLRLPDGRIVGIISIDDPIDGRRPTRESLRPLEAFLNLAAVAIENAELIRQIEEAREKLKEYAERLEIMVEERTRALKESEEKRIKAERLAAIGELAASIAHDLRNPLTGINGAVYYLKMKNKFDSKCMEMLEVIEKAIKHCNKIVNDLLDFSRDIHISKIRVNLRGLVEESLRQVSIPANVRVRNLTAEVYVPADPDQMRRVFVNIMKNAVEAMPKGGTLEITSRTTRNYVTVSFRDTGVGIPEENLNKIFSPLFTTKPKGIGLGLSICKRIVDAHGGRIEFESKRGVGTTFRVILPRRDKHEKGEKERS